MLSNKLLIHRTPKSSNTWATLMEINIKAHPVFYFLSAHPGRKLRMSMLPNKILEKTKRFFEVPAYKQYAIADEIYRFLFNQKWDTEIENGKKIDIRQLAFFFP